MRRMPAAIIPQIVLFPRQSIIFSLEPGEYLSYRRHLPDAKRKAGSNISGKGRGRLTFIRIFRYLKKMNKGKRYWMSMDSR